MALESPFRVCVDVGYQNCIASFFSTFFTAHPLLYVWPAMEELDTVFLTVIQKSNDLDVHERHSVEVQRNPRLSAFNLRFQFTQMLGLQPTAHANHRLETADFSFNSYCHVRSATQMAESGAMKGPVVSR